MILFVLVLLVVVGLSLLGQLATGGARLPRVHLDVLDWYPLHDEDPLYLRVLQVSLLHLRFQPAYGLSATVLGVTLSVEWTNYDDEVVEGERLEVLAEA